MTTPDLAEQLASVELFAGLAPEVLARLADRAVVEKHQAGRTIPDDLGLHLVLDGEAAVIVEGSTYRMLDRGDYFGEISVLDGLPRTATVAAISHLQTLLVPRDIVVELLSDDPAFARRLIGLLCERLRVVDASI